MFPSMTELNALLSWRFAAITLFALMLLIPHAEARPRAPNPSPMFKSMEFPSSSETRSVAIPLPSLHKHRRHIAQRLFLTTLTALDNPLYGDAPFDRTPAATDAALRRAELLQYARGLGQQNESSDNSISSTVKRILLRMNA